MSKSDKDKLTDAVMGEAVIAIIKSGSDVSFNTLLEHLQNGLRTETDSERQDAYRAAIGGVHNFRILRTERQSADGRQTLKQNRSKLLFDTILNSNTTKH